VAGKDDEVEEDAPQDDVATEPRASRLTRTQVQVGLAVVAALIVGIVVGRVTAPEEEGAADSDTDSHAASEPLPFPSGDVNRTGYWGFADLEPTVIDTFDRPDDPESLGSAGTGQEWEAVSGTWGIADSAALTSDGGGGADENHIAVVPEGSGDGLTEVTMTVVEEGAGLVFRYLDPENYWSVTANPSAGSWSATRVLDGEPELVGEFPCQTSDGTTVSVTQSGAALRFLIEGQECLTLNDGALSDQLQGGLIAAPDSSGDARWNRFLVMRFRTNGSGRGESGG
jgi:hypothetical protein